MYVYKPKGSSKYHFGYYDKDLGRTRHKSTKTDNKTLALKFARDYVARLELGLIQKDRIKNYTISEAFNLFIDHHDYAKKTIEIYKISVDHLIAAIGDKNVQQVDSKDYLQFVSYLNQLTFKANRTRISKKLTTNAKATYVREVRVFFSFLKKFNLVKENNIALIKSEKKLIRTIPDEDLQIILLDLMWTNITQYNIVMFKYLAALRRNELLTLKVSDIDLDKKELLVVNKKANKNDKIPIPDDLVDHLNSFDIPKSGLIFPKLTANVISTFWNRSMKRLGFKYNIHLLRKTRGSQLAELGVNAFFLRDFMRHQDIKTTQDYYLSINIKKSRDEINSSLSKIRDI